MLRAGAVVAVLILATGCGNVATESAWTDVALARLQEDIAAAREDGGTSLPGVELSVRPGGSVAPQPCDQPECRRLVALMLLQDLEQYPDRILLDGAQGAGGSVELVLPGRFWSMSFGVDGSLLGAGLTLGY